jgi:hypothetical protein
VLTDGLPRFPKDLVYPVEFEFRTVPVRFLLVAALITCLLEWVCSIRIVMSENEMLPFDTRTNFWHPLVTGTTLHYRSEDGASRCYRLHSAIQWYSEGSCSVSLKLQFTFISRFTPLAFALAKLGHHLQFVVFPPIAYPSPWLLLANMQFLSHTERWTDEAAQMEKKSSVLADPEHTSKSARFASEQKVTFVAVFLGLVASMGGFM